MPEVAELVGRSLATVEREWKFARSWLQTRMAVVALASVQPGWAESSRFDQLLAVLSGGGAAFSVYLTFVSITILHATCQWCLVSLALILGIFALSVWSLVSGRGASVTSDQ